MFTNRCRRGDVLDVPIKHGEGCYVADDATVRALEAGRQIVFRYTDAEGRVTPETNPNGSLRRDRRRAERARQRLRDDAASGACLRAARGR